MRPVRISHVAVTTPRGSATPVTPNPQLFAGDPSTHRRVLPLHMGVRPAASRRHPHNNNSSRNSCLQSLWRYNTSMPACAVRMQGMWGVLLLVLFQRQARRLQQASLRRCKQLTTALAAAGFTATSNSRKPCAVIVLPSDA